MADDNTSKIVFHARQESPDRWAVSCPVLGIDFIARTLQEAHAKIPLKISLWGCYSEGEAARYLIARGPNGENAATADLGVSWRMVVDGPGVPAPAA